MPARRSSPAPATRCGTPPTASRSTHPTPRRASAPTSTTSCTSASASCASRLRTARASWSRPCGAGCSSASTTASPSTPPPRFPPMPSPGTCFGQIFLSAPDVDANLFRQLAGVYPQVAERTTLYVADQDKAIAAMEWMSEGGRAGGAPPVLVLPGIDTVRVHGSSLFRLGHSYFAEEPEVLRDIRAQLDFKDSPAQRRARYGWPVPDEAPGARGA